MKYIENSNYLRIIFDEYLYIEIIFYSMHKFNNSKCVDLFRIV